jgi:hypothetical protein
MLDDFHKEFQAADKEEFKGAVTITNWAISRRQRIVRDISFDSEHFDIFNPEFSSCQASS